MAARRGGEERRGPVSRALGSLWLLFLASSPALLAPAAIGQDETQEAPPPAPQPEIVRSIRIEGLSFYRESTILDAVEQKVGQPLDFEAMRRSMTRLYDSYRVVVQWGVRKVDDGIEVVMQATESPVDFEPRFVGNAEVSTKKLLEWIGLPEEPVVYLAQSERLRQRIVEAYKRHGFHFAEVVLVTHEDPPDVIFDIREGPEVRCTRVIVNGNDAIPDTGWGFWRGGLRELAKMETKGRGPFSWWGKIFDEEVLQADLVALKNVYRDRGWLDVEADVDLVFNDARDEVVVHLTIDEGPLYHVASLAVRACVAPPPDEKPEDVDVEALDPEELVFPEKDLLAECKMGPGKPFEQERLESDRKALQDYYGERGYIDADLFERERDASGRPVAPEGWMWLTPAQVVDYERKEVHLTYRVHQGRPRTIREVYIRGNEHTRDKVVRREISALPGKTANLREIKRSLGRIYGLGYFSDQMDPEHRDPVFILHETDDPDQLDVEYLVSEGRVVDFQISGGVTSDNGLIGILSLGMRNFDASSPPDSLWSTFGDIYRKEAFHGNGELLMIDVSPGTEINSARIRYSYPDLFGTQFNRWTADVDARLQDRSYESHDENRQRAEVELGHIFNFDHKLELGLVWQDVRLSDLSTDDVLPDTLINSEGTSEFHGLSAGYTYYNLDNRLSPADGYYFRAQNTVYGGVLGGDEDFSKAELTFDFYDRFGSEELGTVGPGMYLGFATGVAAPYGDTDFVNYAERFFMGGSLTMRGFDFRGVGPFIDENGKFSEFAIGGETYLRGTAEFRFPLYTVPLPGTTRRREMFRGILFLDWGVLGPDAFQLAIDDTRVSTGFAFGLAYPIPLTFNFGWPLRDGPGDQLEVFSFRLQFH
jgi:outer membrane protein insertion porin family